MSQQVVEQIRSKYPTPLGSKHADFLIEVASALGFGLVSKPSGTRIATPFGVDVSQDVVMDRKGNAWDILRDGEGAATPVFNKIDPIDVSRYVAVPVPVQPEPEPEVEPGPEGPTGPSAEFVRVLAEFTSLKDILKSIEDRQKGLDTRLDDLVKKPVVQFSVKFPNYIGRFFGASVVLRPDNGNQNPRPRL